MSQDLFYEGMFKKGRKHGFAKVWSNKSENWYAGHFREDQKHLYGIHYRNDNYYVVFNWKGKEKLHFHIKEYSDFIQKLTYRIVYKHKHLRSLISYVFAATK